jgi:hypothetical protein
MTQVHPSYKRLRCFKLTEDDWYPSYQIKGYHKGVLEPKLVEVSFMQLSNGQWRVCIWGQDDDGMERDYSSRQKKIAKAMYEQILERDYINKGWLRDQGFQQA